MLAESFGDGKPLLVVTPAHAHAGPKRGDPCPVCACTDTWIFVDAIDGPEMLCYACVQESLTPGDDGYPEGW